MQLSVDGYVGGPDGDLDWRTWNYDDQLKTFADNLRDEMFSNGSVTFYYEPTKKLLT